MPRRRVGEVGRMHREPVHRGVVEEGDVVRGADRGGQGAPEGGAYRHALGRQRADSGEHPGLLILDGAQAAHATTCAGAARSGTSMTRARSASTVIIRPRSGQPAPVTDRKNGGSGKSVYVLVN